MDKAELLGKLGARIRTLRLEKDLTQNDLANLCSLAKASLSRIESGQSNITVITLDRIAEGLEAPIAELFAD